MSPSSSTVAPQTVPVWDSLVRVTHWAVALGIFINLWVTEAGSEVHQYIGYAVVALVVLRLLWGFVGSRYARFRSFFPTPTRLKQHIQTLTHYRQQGEKLPVELGHNPLAALMMFALWGVILALGVTGYLQTTDRFWGDDTMQEIHSLLADSLYVLVPLHVAAAIIMGRLQKQNLVKSMFTGKKSVD